MKLTEPTKIIVLRFDGVTFEVKASSKYRHGGSTLGSYRNSPFLTGDYSANGLKTEILDIVAREWERVADYLISDGDRWVNSTINWKLHRLNNGTVCCIRYTEYNADYEFHFFVKLQIIENNFLNLIRR